MRVIEQVESGAKGHRWLCKCDCGNEKIVYADYLKKGITTSCGCLAHRNFKRRDLYTEDGFLNLRIAIIEQAICDWYNGSSEQKKALEKWFVSDWGDYISGGTGKIIVEKLRKGRLL